MSQVVGYGKAPIGLSQPRDASEKCASRERGPEAQRQMTRTGDPPLKMEWLLHLFYFVYLDLGLWVINLFEKVQIVHQPQNVYDMKIV